MITRLIAEVEQVCYSLSGNSWFLFDYFVKLLDWFQVQNSLISQEPFVTKNIEYVWYDVTLEVASWIWFRNERKSSLTFECLRDQTKKYFAANNLIQASTPEKLGRTFIDLSILNFFWKFRTLVFQTVKNTFSHPHWLNNRSGDSKKPTEKCIALIFNPDCFYSKSR